MSVQSEITRITTAKNSIRAAIEYQGKTPPANAKISDYSGYIYDINRVKNGNVSGSYQNTDYQIDTGYSRINYFVLAKRSGTVNGLECAVYDGSSVGGVVRDSTGTTRVLTSGIIEIDGGIVTVKASAGGYSGCGINGTYRWMAREE